MESDDQQRPGIKGLLPGEWLALASFVFGASVFAADVRARWTLLVDDAFITFRYAENIAAGHGIVWNIGEDPVEGYSCPLLLFLLVPFAIVGADLSHVVRCLNLAIHALLLPGLLLVVVLRLPWDRDSSLRQLALFVPGLWLLFQPNVIHSLSGMDTSLTMLLYTLFSVSIWMLMDQKHPSAAPSVGMTAWVTCLAILVAFSRSESVAIAAIGAALLLRDPTTRWAGIATAGALVLCLVLYLAWKKSYFGYLLPNPYYHKVAGSEAGSLPGLLRVSKFMVRNAGFVALSTLGIIWTHSVHRTRGLALEWMSLLGFLFYVLFMMRVEHVMGFAYRFNWHSMPFLVLLAIAALWRLSSKAMTSAGVITLALLLIAEGSMWGLYNPGKGLLRPLPFASTVDNPFVHYVTNERIGTILRDLRLPYATTINGMEAGLIPYLSATRSIDLVGLNDNVITRGTEQEVREYKLRNLPDVTYVVSTTGALDDFVFDNQWGTEDMEDREEWNRRVFSRYAAEYAYAGTMHWNADDTRRFLNIWIRREFSQARRTFQAFRSSADRFDPSHLLHGPYPQEILSNVSALAHD